MDRSQFSPCSPCCAMIGGALQLNVHYHAIVIEEVFLDRTDRGLKPRFIQGEPPSDADIATVLQKISRRVVCTLRHLGYLEAGIDDAVATGYDPLSSEESALARTMAASVKQRIAFGERAGQNVDVIIHRLGSAAVRVHISQVTTTPAFCNSCRPTTKSSRSL